MSRSSCWRECWCWANNIGESTQSIVILSVNKLPWCWQPWSTFRRRQTAPNSDNTSYGSRRMKWDFMMNIRLISGRINIGEIFSLLWPTLKDKARLYIEGALWRLHWQSWQCSILSRCNQENVEWFVGWSRESFSLWKGLSQNLVYSVSPAVHLCRNKFTEVLLDGHDEKKMKYPQKKALKMVTM